LTAEKIVSEPVVESPVEVKSSETNTNIEIAQNSQVDL
jgi:hypothetical protein